MVGSEGHPERRRHDIELVIAERQRLPVGLHPLKRDSEGLGFPASGLEVLWRDVRRDDLGTYLGRRDRDVPGAGRHVEDALTGGDPTRRDDDGTDLPHLHARETVVIAQPPYGARRGHTIRLHSRPPGRRRVEPVSHFRVRHAHSTSGMIWRHAA